MTNPPGEFVKISTVMHVSQEMLDANPPDIMSRLLNPPPDTRTPYQREMDQARYERETREIRHRIQAEHLAAIEAGHPKLRAVLELHRPEFCDLRDRRPRCEGCDGGGYDYEAPDFPCRTYALVAGIEDA